MRYLLIGGFNFFLRHEPLATFDIDLWIEDEAPNRHRCAEALASLEAECCPDEDNWWHVSQLSIDWISRQSIFCLASPHGSIVNFSGSPRPAKLGGFVSRVHPGSHRRWRRVLWIE